jgi:hypothetical protein|tara:strand:- start:1178 stop:2812 length:1635 start_codon:yes stop_codon:yes gene_type:complete
MNGQSESEQLQNFHERLSQWVSSQGFWFQLRYSMSGGGAKGAFAFHFLKLAARVGVFVVIIAIGVWVFLVKQSSASGYQENLKTSLKEKFGATEIELKGFSKNQGEFYISRLAMSGGEETFFSGVELKSLKCRKGLFDFFKKDWDPGLIEISRVNLEVRAGADSKESAKAIGDILLQDTGRIKIRAIEVADMSMKWGYSERTRGAIIGSKMRAQRLENSWRLRFKGGTFSQNWLKGLEIEELEVVFGRQGIVFEKAVFRKNGGYVTLVGMKVKSGERPEVSGKMNIRKMSVSSIVPVAVRNFVEGTVSGEFEVTGSTNSTEGIGFEGDIILQGEDMIVLRDRIHLLRALSVVDAFNTYRRVDFRDGSLHLKSHAGKLEVTKVNLSAEELFRMNGELTVRLPTEDEAKIFVDPGSGDGGFDVILSDEELGKKPDLTLRAAAKRGGKGIGFTKSEDESLFNRLGLSVENRRLEERAAAQLSRSLRYEGEFTISLKDEAFARAPKLAEMFPVDAKTNRIPMAVPLDGILYDLTLEQTELIYKNGSRP